MRIQLDKTAGLLRIIAGGLLKTAGDWFPATVDVKSPEGETFHFPIHHWITNNEVHEFREATGTLNLPYLNPYLKQGLQIYICY